MTDKKRCFIIMPFGKHGTPEYDRNMKIYKLMIKPVVEKCGYESIRADELEHVGSITRDIIELLHGSELVIADLTGRNANVFYELGVRHVLYRCGTIPIIKKGESLPFDIANYRAIFYTSELDGPELFKNELEMRIKAFEKYQAEKSDNPVHDILGNSLQYVNLKDYVSLSDYNAREREFLNLLKNYTKLEKQTAILKKECEKLRRQNDTLGKEKLHLKQEINYMSDELPQSMKGTSKIKNYKVSLSQRIKFRDQPTRLSEKDVVSIAKHYDFFDTSLNKKGSGFRHEYIIQEIFGFKIVIDLKTGLMWQQAGSSESMNCHNADKWIASLNEKNYASYNNWGLPTLEEAMSLLEPKVNEVELYINSIFNKKQLWIWTSDLVINEKSQWFVDFSNGYCYSDSLEASCCGYVRAVRSI
ncbi:MAG: DUF1566 domain-containing protein [Candidatus Lokiarchaeota archaeon]|nr:DUF1566 domain-containing protein [Candidatus Lokiarchaeota archaeon]